MIYRQILTKHKFFARKLRRTSTKMFTWSYSEKIWENLHFNVNGIIKRAKVYKKWWQRAQNNLQLWILFFLKMSHWTFLFCCCLTAIYPTTFTANVFYLHFNSQYVRTYHSTLYAHSIVFMIDGWMLFVCNLNSEVNYNSK